MDLTCLLDVQLRQALNQIIFLPPECYLPAKACEGAQSKIMKMPSVSLLTTYVMQ